MCLRDKSQPSDHDEILEAMTPADDTSYDILFCALISTLEVNELFHTCPRKLVLMPFDCETRRLILIESFARLISMCVGIKFLKFLQTGE